MARGLLVAVERQRCGGFEPLGDAIGSEPELPDVCAAPTGAAGVDGALDPTPDDGSDEPDGIEGRGA